MISGHGTIETAVTAIKKGAYDFLEKPFNADRLLVLIERAREAARLKRENAELKLKLGDERELIGTLAGDPAGPDRDPAGRADRVAGPDHRPARESARRSWRA